MSRGRSSVIRPVIFAAAAVFAAGPASAQGRSGDACLVAQIVAISGVSRRGEITIVAPTGRGPGREREARLRECLRPGEQVRVLAPDPAKVIVRVFGRAATLTARTPPLTIPARDEPGFWARFSAWIRSFRVFSATPEVAVAETYARRGLAEVRPHPLLPAGEQFFPLGQASLTVIWDGPPAGIELANAADRIVRGGWGGEGNRLTFDGLSLNGRYVLKVSSGLRYPVVATASPIPEPAWMEGRISRSEDERAARAVWILVEGPPAWRLFALDDLRRLRATSFAAERMWEWVLTLEGPVTP